MYKFIMVCFMYAFTFKAFSQELLLPEADAQMVANMIEDSDLVKCQSGKCAYVLDDEAFTGVDNPRDGYLIVFPEGKYSPLEQARYAEFISEFWLTTLALKEKNCESEMLSLKYKQQFDCKEL